MKISFDNIHSFGKVIFENEQYKHYYFPEMPQYYSGNFIAFKSMPSIKVFEETARYLKDFHEKNGQNHVLFFFPENQKPDEALQKYLDEQDYDYSYNELYILQPENFPKVTSNSDIEVEAVTEETLATFLDLQYNIDLEFGEDFAKGKRKIHKENYLNENWQQVIGYYKGKPAGTFDLIISNHTVEIDSFTVLESYRKKGIGTQMQKYVMDQFPNHFVILVAEGEGTARTMYQKQNYQYAGFQYEVLKIFHNV